MSRFMVESPCVYAERGALRERRSAAQVVEADGVRTRVKK